MIEPSIAIVEGYAAIESLMDVDGGSGKTEATGLRMDLQPLAIPLHDVVVADDTLVSEAADAVEIFWSRPPGFFCVARSAGEAAVVVCDELSQYGVGRVQIARLGQAEFAGKAILQHPPETLDAALSLRRLRGDEGDAELMESAAELSGLLSAGELFVDGPVLVIASEDSAAIAVKGDRDAVAAQQALQQPEVALGSFRGEKLSGQDFAGSIVLHAQGGEQRAAAFEPVVRGTVKLDQFALTSRAQPALAMSGRSAFARRADAFPAEQPT